MVPDAGALDIPGDAFWIGSDHPFDLQETYLCFRSPADWRLAEMPNQAELFISADSRYKLWVNGSFVGRGPARCYPEAQTVDALNISAHLQAGDNLLAVQVYQPGYSHFSYVHRGATAVFVYLVCDGEVSLVSDDRWHVQRDPSYAPLVPRASIYAGGIEDRDLRLAENWVDPVFDDGRWSRARVVASPGDPPWTGLHLREMPLLEEHDTPMRLVETRIGSYGEERRHDPHLALRSGWFTAERQSLSMDTGGWYHPRLAEDQAAYWLFDLGRDYTCQGWAEIVGAGGYEQLSICYAEKIREGEIVIPDPETYCRLRLTDRFHLRACAQVAESFALRGGRYLLFQLAGPTDADFGIRLHARVAEYPLEITRPLHSSDPILAAVIQLCETTFHACLQDGFVDCVWRESSQWVGDALPQALIMAAIVDDHRPLKQVIVMAAQGAYPDGVLASVVPGEVHAYAVLDYNFTWVELLRLYWQLTGDDPFVLALWPTLIKMLDRFHADLRADGLIRSQPGRRLFLDWSPVSRREPNAIYNLRYLFALHEAIRLAEALKLKTREVSRWRMRADDVQLAMRSAFWHAGRWYDDEERGTFSQLAAALALLTQSNTAEEVAPLLEAIIARSMDLDDDSAPGRMVLASPFMHHYIFEALRKHQKSDAVVEIVRQRWGRWAEAGYPTAWENWTVDFPDGSQCHAFSAHPRFHLAEIAKNPEALIRWKGQLSAASAA